MQDLPIRSPNECDDFIFSVRSPALVPLLEFDNHRMIGVGLPFAGDHEI